MPSTQAAELRKTESGALNYIRATFNTSTHQQILLHSVISNIPKSGTVNEKGERTRDATSAISNSAIKKPTATIQGQPTKIAHTLSATFS
jgi:hypothetical protein